MEIVSVLIEYVLLQAPNYRSNWWCKITENRYLSVHVLIWPEYERSEAQKIEQVLTWRLVPGGYSVPVL